MFSSTQSLVDISGIPRERNNKSKNSKHAAVIHNRARSVEPKNRRHRPDRRQLSEVKIQNADSCYSVFENFCDSFEVLLNEINLSKNKGAVEKLLKVQNLIQTKISNFEKGDLGVESLDLCDLLVLPEDVISTKDKQFLDDPLFQEFLTAIICPFCLKRQESKSSFIQHLDKDCSVHLEKKVKSNEPFPFAEFQVLPNSCFKCNICHNSVMQNLRAFHQHMQNMTHERAYVKAAQVKNYRRCLYCSICKVLVPSTYTQIDSHIKHKIHKERATKKKNTAYFLNNGFFCIFNDSKKFKCLICLNSKVTFDTPASMLEHIQTESHHSQVSAYEKQKKLKFRNLGNVYCEFCSDGVNVFEILIHFNSSSHNICESKLNRSFELCFYCGSTCDTLMDLLVHMKSECDEINSIRQKNIKTEKISKGKGSQKTTEKADLLEDNVKGSSIIVKDYVQIPKLYKYFKEFGDISAVELYNDKNVVLQFPKKSIVDDILLVRDLIKIDGVKLEIEVVENICVSNEEHQEADKGGETSGETIKGDENSHETSDESDDKDHDEKVIENDQLEELFQRACNYLKKAAERDAKQATKIISDCISTVNLENCTATGFSGCGLSFASESLNLCCCIDTSPSLKSSLAFITSEMLSKSLARMSEESFLHSDLWTDVVHVQGTPYPYIKCVHKASKKACTIIFSQSSFLLTEMLRECMEKNKLVQPFCLAIRLWLSVHELLKKDCEYATISLLVFFLIHKSIVKLSSRFVTPKFCGGINGVEASSDVEVDSLPKLFHEFLRFLNKFDFNTYAICLPFRHPVPKTCFTAPAFKEESGIKNPAPLISSAMCFLDPILFVNLGFAIKQKNRQELLDTVKLSIENYKIV